jgi:hypothetical protein
MVTGLDGRVDVGKVSGTTQTAGDIVANEVIIAGYIDTEVAAIKAKTDQLTFTVANQVDSNVLDWKSATAPAMTGDAFARLGAPAGASVSADVAAVKTDTAAIKLKTDNLPASPASTTNITAAAGIAVSSIGANVITAGSINAAALNGKGDWNVGKTGYALSAAGVQAIWDALTSALTTVSSIGKLLVDNINATISSRLASASYTAPLDAAGTRTAVGLATANLDTQLGTIDDFLDTEIAAIKLQTDKIPSSPAATGDAMTLTAGERTSIATAVWASGTRTLSSFGTLIADIWAAVTDSAGVTTLLSRLTSGRATGLDHLDADVSTRLATSSYTAPDNADILLIKAKTDNLPASPAATGDIPTSDITAIKAKTDHLTFTVTNQVDANMQSVNDTAVTGTGESGDEWGPA